jgi:YfiH family protein
VLGLLTADCAAVVLAGDGVVGMVHAGWRGLAAGVIERAMLALAPVWGAWVGPAIRACCYEVGQDVVEAFRANDLPLARPNHVDIVDAARVVLLRAGVQRITVNEDCTGCQDRYFSFRRERETGRQGTFVWMIGA